MLIGRVNPWPQMPDASISPNQGVAYPPFVFPLKLGPTAPVEDFAQQPIAFLPRPSHVLGIVHGGGEWESASR